MKNGVATMPRGLPESARLLGIVCDALRIALPRNRKETGRRFLTGERALPEETRIAIVRSLVAEAIALGYLGDVADAVGKERDRWIDLVTSGLIVLMQRWDHAVGHLVAVPSPMEGKPLLAACLRAAVVDVAIRVAAFRLLANVPFSPATKSITLAEAPRWARPGGAVAGLAERVKERGITRDALHESNSLDDWLSGRRRPSPTSLRQLAIKLAGDEAISSWRLHFLWDFGLAYLAELVRSAVGDDVVNDLAATLRRLIYLSMYPITSLPEDHREAVLRELVQWGAMVPGADGLYELLQQQEALAGRVEWARALALGGRPWPLLWFVAILPPVPDLPSAVSIPHEVTQRLNAWNRDPERDSIELLKICESHPAMFVSMMRVVVHRAVASGQFDIAAPIVARLADAVGGSELHLEAAMLFAGADQHGEAARHLAAIPPDDALRSAADVLAAMSNLVLGRHREALQTLDTIEGDVPVLLVPRAEALLGVGKASAALDLVQKVIAREPLHAAALELAARCCAALGRTRDATRYAKEARRLGQPPALPTKVTRRARKRR